MEIANPPVSVAGLDPTSLNLITLPVDFKSVDLPSVESASEYPLFEQWIKEDEHALLKTGLEETGLCDDLPDVRNPLPLNEVGALPGYFPSIFAKSTDAVTGEEVVFLYDRHLSLLENTVENPVSSSHCTRVRSCIPSMIQLIHGFITP